MICDKCTTVIKQGDSYAEIGEEDSPQIILCDECFLATGKFPKIPLGMECYFYANNGELKTLEEDGLI